MWLWAAWRGHMAVCVSRQLRHLLALIPLAVSRQHGHCHRRHRHGNGIPWLPGCHQGEQVPASECELNLSMQDLLSETRLPLHTTTTDPTPFLSFPAISGPLLLMFLLIAHANIGGDGLSHMCLYTHTCCSQANTKSYQYLSSSWYHSGRRRVTGGVQCALCRTSGADKGRLELSSGILPSCKLTAPCLCSFNRFGHSPVKELSVKRALCVTACLSYSTYM